MGTLPERFRPIVSPGGYSGLMNEGNDSVVAFLFDNTPTWDVKRLYGVQWVLMDKTVITRPIRGASFAGVIRSKITRLCREIMVQAAKRHDACSKGVNL